MPEHRTFASVKLVEVQSRISLTSSNHLFLPVSVGWGDLAKPKTGSWECSGCLLRQNGDVVKCPACGTMKPGATSVPAPETKLPNVAVNPTGGFKFGSAT